MSLSKKLLINLDQTIIILEESKEEYWLKILNNVKSKIEL